MICKIDNKNKYINKSIASVYIPTEKLLKYYTSLAVINDHQVFWSKNIESYYTLYKLYISKYLIYEESLKDDISLNKVDKVRILYNIVNNEKNITFCCDKIVENFTLLVNSIEDYNEYSHNILSI